MDLKQLLAVVTVSEVGSVTRAAQVLHVVQPAVTRQIRSLEDELGVTLFERNRTGMVATPAGEALVERARRALLELERARAELRSTPEEVKGIVTVGLLESSVELVAPAIAEAVAEHHPQVELRLLSAYSGHLQGWLDDGTVDMSLLYDLTGSETLAVVPLLAESLWAIAPPSAGLDPERPVPWAEVSAHPLVLPVSGHGLRTVLDRAWADLGPEAPLPVTAIETNSMALQKQLVAAGRGWTVLPAVGVAGDVAAGRFSGAPLTQPAITRTVTLAVQRGGRVPLHVQAVSTLMVRVVRQLASTGTWPSAVLPARS